MDFAGAISSPRADRRLLLAHRVGICGRYWGNGRPQPLCSPSRPPRSAAEFCAKLSWTAPRRSLGILRAKIFGVTTIYKEGTPSVHRGWRRPPRGQGLPHSVGIAAARDGDYFGDLRFENLASRSMCFTGGMWQSAGGARPAVPSRPTRRSCGRGARVLPGQPGPQRLRSAFTAPDPAPNDERMGLRGSNCQG